MKKLIITSAIFCTMAFSQQVVDVADLTFKVSAEWDETLYYGFEKGDKILFSFEEANGKELKNVEVFEYPNNSKFMDYETKKIENKQFNVTQKSVYGFKFTNSSILKGRVCKVKIQRIPKDESTLNFNTQVQKIKVTDTVWNQQTKQVVAGYDTLYLDKRRRVLDEEKVYEEQILEKNQKVPASGLTNNNKTYVWFNLPSNESNGIESRKVIAWAYWVGVGKESNQVWESNKKIIGSSVDGLGSLFLSPLGAFALGSVTKLALPTGGEDVKYGIAADEDRNLFMKGYDYRTYDSGKGTGGYKKFTDQNMMQGRFNVILYNDNVMHEVL